ncbi:MAG: hypothetical protein D6689_04580 [Deltaproteobacteria bacterium]|nr:MAG: hypothetical protein D6689_04580 [Deltaproteobacteria bacterium]
MSTETVAVIVSAPGRRLADGRVQRRQLDRSARTRRAAAALGACWGLAVVAVFIPVAHFVLVPSLTIAGPIVAWLRARQRAVVLGGDGTCPACGASIEIEPGPAHWPLHAQCAACREALEVTARA